MDIQHKQLAQSHEIKNEKESMAQGNVSIERANRTSSIDSDEDDQIIDIDDIIADEDSLPHDIHTE